MQPDGLARRSLGVVPLRAGKEAVPWRCFLCVVHALGSVRYRYSGRPMEAKLKYINREQLDMIMCGMFVGIVCVCFFYFASYIVEPSSQASSMPILVPSVCCVFCPYVVCFRAFNIFTGYDRYWLLASSRVWQWRLRKFSYKARYNRIR